MESIKPCPIQTRSKFAKTFQKVIHLKKATKTHSNNGFCLLIPQEKLSCFDSKNNSQHFDKDDVDEAKQSKNRAAMEAFIAKLFATISAAKAAYAELQIAQFPYNANAVQAADQAVVDELKAISELKQCFMKKQIDSSPPHVTVLLAEIQEQQSLMKTYELTMKKMQSEIDARDSKIDFLREVLNEINLNNRTIEKKLNASGSFSILDKVKPSDSNLKDLIMVLHYAMRSIRNFVKTLIREMESANWDIEAAANAMQPHTIFNEANHRCYAFESFVCRELFEGFNDPVYNLPKDSSTDLNHQMGKRFFFDQFKELKSVSSIHILKQNPNSWFGKFTRKKYLSLVHPKMETSFSGNLNQRKMVNAGEFPETAFFKAFAEMARRVWIWHCLAFVFENEVSIFQVKKNCRFSEVYMECVNDDLFTAAADGNFKVAFMVVPGFKAGKTVIPSQVYLSPATNPSRS